MPDVEEDVEAGNLPEDPADAEYPPRDTDEYNEAADLEEDPTDDDGDERPEIEDDERAELDLSGIDLEAVDDEDDDQDDQDGAGEEPTTSAGPAVLEDDDQGGSSGAENVDWGDMYVDILALVLVSIVDEYGDGESDMDSEDIMHLANQPPVKLNEQANRVFAEMTGAEDLPPGQALVIGTATLGATVLMKETDVMNDVVGEMSGQLGGSR